MEERGVTLAAPGEVDTRPMAVTGARSLVLAQRLLVQVAESLWLPPEESEETRTERIRAAVAAVAGLAPRDELEGMLAAQMVAMHAAAMECLHRAAAPGEEPQVRAEELHQAARLAALYARQVEVLDRRRGGPLPRPGAGSGREGGGAVPAPAQAAP